MRFCPSAGGIPLLLQCNYLFPFVCFCFPRPSVLYSFPVVSYTRLLAAPTTSNPLLPISMRAYLLFTAPRGYLSFSPLHCECHSDTRIPQSTGPDPHPLHRKALTPHLHTWGGRSQNLCCCIKIRGDVDASYTTYINVAACCNTETKCLLVMTQKWQTKTPFEVITLWFLSILIVYLLSGVLVRHIL